MATIEDVLKDTLAIFDKQAKEALEAALSKAYEEYLPHVENDTYFNVRQQARRWLESFLSDSLTEEDMAKLVCGSNYGAGKVRQKIYEENKEEIQKAIGGDLQNEIDCLKQQLASAYRSY